MYSGFIQDIHREKGQVVAESIQVTRPPDMTKFKDTPGTRKSDIDWTPIDLKRMLDAVSLMKELREKTKVPVTPFLHWGVETDAPRRIVVLTNTCAMCTMRRE
jgi:hypothetical protein